MLSVEESKGPSSQKIYLDLTSFSGSMLGQLAAFTAFLKDQDKVNLTKVLRTITSYREFQEFKSKGF